MLRGRRPEGGSTGSRRRPPSIWRFPRHTRATIGPAPADPRGTRRGRPRRRRTRTPPPRASRGSRRPRRTRLSRRAGTRESTRCSSGPRRKGNVTRRASSRVLFLRILVARIGAGLVVFVFDRLLDDLFLDERLGRDRLADHPARNRVRGRSSGRRRRYDRGRRLRPRWSLGGGRSPDGLTGRGWDLHDASAATRWPLHLAHQRSALVADVGRHGVEGAARRAWLRAHLAHLLFLAEPVFERHEGGLFLPPLLELAVGQVASELPGGLLPQLRHDLVVLQSHLLLVIRHFDLAGRELDAALRALLHVDRDPGLAVRALRHVPFELDAALRARRRVLRDEGAALAALDHLAEAVNLA